MSEARVECGACHHYNESGSKYCAQCGTLLQTAKLTVSEELGELKLKKSKFPAGIILTFLAFGFVVMFIVFAALR